MPARGWVVDTDAKTCRCPYMQKTGVCVHLLLACEISSVPVPGVTWSNQPIARRGRLKRKRRGIIRDENYFLSPCVYTCVAAVPDHVEAIDADQLHDEVEDEAEANDPLYPDTDDEDGRVEIVYSFSR